MEGGELKTVFYADDRKYELALPGKFNVYNALAALQTVSCLGFERDQPEVRERPKEDESVRAGQPKARILFAWRKGLRHQ